MSTAAIGLAVSGAALALLLLFFRHEEKAGIRYFSRARIYADVLVLRAFRAFHDLFRFIGRDFVRGMFHYAFHKFLHGILVFLRRIEEGIRNAMRTNKTLAENIEVERETRTKLEEIAFHKAANALSEEEKRERKEKTLNGF